MIHSCSVNVHVSQYVPDDTPMVYHVDVSQ